MVDYRTYSQMHPSEKSISDDHTGYEITHDDDFDHGDKDFFTCLPTRIPGFNMQKKEWGKFNLIIYDLLCLPTDRYKSIWMWNSSMTSNGMIKPSSTWS